MKRSKKQTFYKIRQRAPIERIELIRKGIPASAIANICSQIDLPMEVMCRYLRLSKSATQRQISQDRLLAPAQSERVLGLLRLLAKTERMLAESGSTKGFDAARWLGHWLCNPCPALGGLCPGSFMDTIAGQELVSSLLGQMQSASYS